MYLMDEAGRRLASRRLPEGLTGIRQLHELVAAPCAVLEVTGWPSAARCGSRSAGRTRRPRDLRFRSTAVEPAVDAGHGFVASLILIFGDD